LSDVARMVLIGEVEFEPCARFRLLILPDT
jgi:hypothetical protein